MLTCAAVMLVLPATGHAEGSPAITLAVSAPSPILYGSNASFTLEAANPGGQPYGYNLSYRAILPAGASFVSGSSHLGSGAAAPTPSVIANEPSSGQTTLIWSNVGDLSPGSHEALGFSVTPAHGTYAPGSTLHLEAGAYIASQPRFLPKFSAQGIPQGPGAESFTGSATATGAVLISAIEVTQAETGSREGEILRGVHDHQTVYKVTVTNNTVNPTSGITLDEYLPAALEYLGCGGAGSDHTTDAPSNPGSAEEYPGAGHIEVPTVSGCKAPTLVEAVETDPDGTGEAPRAVYTDVRWSVGALAAGESRTYEFRAAVPLLENTLTWTGTVPTGASGKQAANLDNNSGPETSDGETLLTYAHASGLYEGKTAVSSESHLTRIAKDLTTEKAGSSSTIEDGQITEWTIEVHSSEYRYNTQVEVEDTVPSGLCPLDTANLTTSAECEPDRSPSSPYASAVENANGTWTLRWNETSDPALAELAQNATTTITYFTRTRSHYQANGEATTPILANDTVTNSVLAGATTNVVCSGDSDCSGKGEAPIDHERPLSEPVSDTSSFSQTATGPTIDKQVAESGTECLNDKYTSSTPVYHPGDLICWRLEASFPTTLSTHGTAITDFLPLSATFDEAFNGGRGEAATTADTLPLTSFEHGEAGKGPSGTVRWVLPESGYVGSQGQLFQRVIATTAGLPAKATPGELQGNLMKFSSVNTKEESFALRSEANYELQFPDLSLTKQIVAIEHKAFGPATTATVHGGQAVEFALTIPNSGAQEALGVEVWDELPAGVTCASISAISAGGSCTGGRITWGDVGLGQTALDIAGLANARLTFTTEVPTTTNPATALEDHAGVVEYHGATNLGTEYTYVPEEDIDPTLGLEANAPVADASASIETEDVKFEKTHTSPETAGDTARQATIGELVTFEVSATLPAGTTLSGEAHISDPGLAAERLLYQAGSAEALVGGSPAGGEFKIEEVAGAPVLTLPADYAAPAGEARKVTLRFKTHVANIKGNYGFGVSSESNIPNTALLAWTNPASGAQTREAQDTVPLVEPQVKLTQKNNSGGKIHGRQLLEFKLEAADASGASPAYDSTLVDTVPTNLTPTNKAGEALANGASTESGGVWNESERTITWTLAKIEPAATSALAFFARVNEEPVSATSLTNKAKIVTTSIEGASTFERTAANAPENSKGHYEASSEATLEIEGPTITKASNSSAATIGHRITYTLTVTLPAHVVAYNITAVDTLPESLDFDQYGTVSCASGCPPEAAPEVKEYKPQIGSATTKVAWYLGKLDETATARTIKLEYVASVRSTLRSKGTKVTTPLTIENSATLFYNKVEKGGFEETKIPTSAEKTNGPVAAKTTLVEPKLTLTKELSVDGGAYSSSPASLTDGDTLSYRLTVKNTGTGPAYAVAVADRPPASLEAITPTENSADVTTDKAGEIAWTIVGPIEAGHEVKLAYTAKLVPVAQLEAGQAVDNEASVPTYLGASEAERAEGGTNYAGETVLFREYTGPSTQVTAKVLLPAITVEKTAGGTQAEPLQPFTWHVTVKNTSTVKAKNVSVSDQLPANWEYVAASASFSPGASSEPTESGTYTAGRELRWTTSLELEAGKSTVLTYKAIPRLAAEQSPGTGETHPNVNHASAAVEDLAGHSADKSGPFAAGPVTAQTVLVVPHLEVTKKALHATVAAGEADSYSIAIHNSGSGAAREVLVADTLPTGMTYAAKTATASPSTGFSEVSTKAGAAEWKVAQLAAGATVTITVPVGTSPALASGTVLTNDVAVHSTEEPEPVEASGAIELSTSADLQAFKQIVAGATAVPGTHMTYQLKATNKGPSQARNPKLVDHLPTGLEYVSSSPGCEQAAGVVTCSASSLEAGESMTYEVVVALGASMTGTVSNTVVASSSTPDPEAGNNEASASATVNPSADLSLSKKTLTGPVLDGEPASFELAVRNEGPSDAAEAEVIDTLPEGMSFEGAEGASCSAKGLTVTCLLGALAAGHSDSFTIEVATSKPGTLVNHARVESTTEDPVSANNQAEASLEVLPVAALRLEKTASTPVVKLPGQVTYTLTVEDEGPDGASEVLVTDPLPSGESYVSNDAGCTHTGSTVSCRRASLAAGTIWTIHLVASLPARLGHRTITNVASVSSQTADPSEEGLTAEASITSEPVAGLTLEKVALTPEVIDGQTASFELVARNDGPSEAGEAEIIDTLPSGMSFLHASGAECAAAGQLVTCQLGTLEDEAEADVELTVETREAGVEVNHAEAISSAEAPAGEANKAQASVTVLAGARLTLQKAVNASTVHLPGQLTYTLTARNEGPDAAREVLVVDPLPAQETAVSMSPGCSAEATQTVTCELGELADGAEASVQITVAIGAGAGRSSIVNTAHLESPTADPAGAAAPASATVQTVPVADLELTKAALTPQVPIGGEARFLLTVANRGPSEATETMLVDTLPAGMSFSGASGGACSESGQTVTCALGTLASGQQVEVLLSVHTSAAGLLVNRASVSSIAEDPDPADNQAQASVEVLPAAEVLAAGATVQPTQVSLRKLVAVSHTSAGGHLPYTLIVRDTGAAPALQLHVCDRVPRQTTVINRSGGRLDHGSICFTLTELAPGQSRTFHLLLRTDSTAVEPIVNRATVTGANFKLIEAHTSTPVRGHEAPHRESAVTG